MVPGVRTGSHLSSTRASLFLSGCTVGESAFCVAQRPGREASWCSPEEAAVCCSKPLSVLCVEDGVGGRGGRHALAG